MSSEREDVLELLAPELTSARAASARRLITGLRLLHDELSRPGAERASPDAALLQRELEQHVDANCQRLVGALLHQHLAAALDGRSFAAPPRAACGPDNAWSLLEGERELRPRLPSPPAPGESGVAVARRLLCSLETLEPSAATLGLARARMARFEDGAAAGERAFESLLADLEHPSTARAAALSGLVGCTLDRGAVRLARTRLEQGLDGVALDASLARLLVWCLLLCGEEQRATELWVRAGLRGRASLLREPVPRALLELRRARPSWRRLLQGATHGEAEHGCEPHAGPVECRRSLGAAVLGVYALEPGGGMRRLHFDCAPGLRERAEAWELAREDRARIPHSLEHRLVASSCVQVAWREEGGALPGALAEERAQVLALVPIPDVSGEVEGWLHLECEHSLLPPKARLVAAAASWSERLRQSAAERGGEALLGAPRGRAAVAGGAYGWNSARARVVQASALPSLAIQLPDGEPLEARARSFRALAETLGMKTAQRRWWGFEVRGSEALLVAEGGQALADWDRVPGGARSLQRALRTGSAIHFDEPDEELALHAEASSGLCIALHTSTGSHPGELPCALFAVESNRRRDFRPEDLERLRERASEGTRSVWLGQFRDWHRERFQHDVCLRSDARYLSAQLEALIVAGRTQSPACIHGPAGAGKGVLARLLHFAWLTRSDQRAAPRSRTAPIESFPCAAFELEVAQERLFGPRGSWSLALGGTLVLDDATRLAPQLQRALREHLEACDEHERPRLIALRHADAPAFSDALAQTFERLEFKLPSLAERRDELPALAQVLLQRFAEEEGLRPARLGLPALATLWRQPWSGGLRDLEAFLYKLALLHPGETIDQELLVQLAARFGLPLNKRLPSRRPTKALLQQALDSTRKANGTINKTRAALFLGWDPDTLVLRLRDHGLCP